MYPKYSCILTSLLAKTIYRRFILVSRPALEPDRRRPWRQSPPVPRKSLWRPLDASEATYTEAIPPSLSPQEELHGPRAKYGGQGGCPDPHQPLALSRLPEEDPQARGQPLPVR